jgi:formate hydrogenlyase subunit 6/NADH:ubiquinone oxidoreductase subunit I
MLKDTLSSLFKKPVTEQYPFVRKPAPDRYRGQLEWDASKCTGCMLCVKDCPANAIEIVTIDRAAKRFVMIYHTDRCTYCAQCVETCRFKCLGMSQEQWELAATTKQPFVVHYGKQEDLDALLARENKPCAGEDNSAK